MFETIQATADRLNGYAHKTLVMTSQTLDQRLNAQVFLKCENLRRMIYRNALQLYHFVALSLPLSPDSLSYSLANLEKTYRDISEIETRY